jgi:hypothetical protein
MSRAFLAAWSPRIGLRVLIPVPSRYLPRAPRSIGTIWVPRSVDLKAESTNRRVPTDPDQWHYKGPSRFSLAIRDTGRLRPE